jgi:hypothetical protein
MGSPANASDRSNARPRVNDHALIIRRLFKLLLSMLVAACQQQALATEVARVATELLQ